MEQVNSLAFQVMSSMTEHSFVIRQFEGIYFPEQCLVSHLLCEFLIFSTLFFPPSSTIDLTDKFFPCTTARSLDTFWRCFVFRFMLRLCIEYKVLNGTSLLSIPSHMIIPACYFQANMLFLLCYVNSLSSLVIIFSFLHYLPDNCLHANGSNFRCLLDVLRFLLQLQLMTY